MASYNLDQVPRLWARVSLQIDHYLRTQRGAGLPQWYETKRKTTHVVFWS